MYINPSDNQNYPQFEELKREIDGLMQNVKNLSKTYFYHLEKIIIRRKERKEKLKSLMKTILYFPLGNIVSHTNCVIPKRRKKTTLLSPNKHNTTHFLKTTIPILFSPKTILKLFSPNIIYYYLRHFNFNRYSTINIKTSRSLFRIE